jgi:hypothetical protein
MKKTPRKLVLRSETLRMLAKLDLARAIGGFDSGAQACEGPVVFESGAAQCDAPRLAIATAACG